MLGDLQFIYGTPRFFFRFGFGTSGLPVSYNLLASRLQRLIPPEEFEEAMEDINYLTVPPARGARTNTRRRASSDITSSQTTWQRQVKIQGYNRRRQMAIMESVYGVRLRDRSLNGDEDADDVEVQ